MRADKLPAEQIINEDPVTATNGMNLAQIKNRMEENELRTIAVTDTKGNLEGAISYRELIRFLQFNPQRTKIKKVMHQPPEIDDGSTLVDLADLRINSGRKLLVETSGEKLKGVVGDEEFRKAMPQVDELSNVSTRDLHSYELEKVYEQDKVEEARHLMLDRNISRLPVLNGEGVLSGIIRSTDLLRAMVSRESPDAGGTSGGRSGTKEVNIAGGGEKEKMGDIPVSELMSRNPLSLEEHIDADEAAEKIAENGTQEIIFTDDRYPESILTVKDFIDFVAEFAPGNTVLVNLVGLEVAEEKAAVHNKVKTQLQGSLGRKLDRPEELNIRFKKAEKDGKKHRWEIELKLHSEYGIINIEEEGWEMLEVVDEALDELNSIVRKKKEKRKP